jgi:hypothetical protein
MLAAFAVAKWPIADRPAWRTLRWMKEIVARRSIAIGRQRMTTDDAGKGQHDAFFDAEDLTDPGRERDFEAMGREQLAALLEHGLSPQSRLLDVGCGKLRCGRWVIPVLEAGHYFGIEPVRERVEKGLRQGLDPRLVEIKQPRFDHNSNFDFSVFGMTFTHFVARSIWSHASKAQIETMLDGVAAHGAPGAVCLASFRATGPKRQNDYKGDEWKGRSHDSRDPGIVAHDVRWLDEVCAKRGLLFEVSTRAPVKNRGQVWAVVTKPAPGAEGERLAAERLERAFRRIRHNVKTLRASVGELAEVIRGTEGPLDRGAIRRGMGAVKSAASDLARLVGIETEPDDASDVIDERDAGSSPDRMLEVRPDAAGTTGVTGASGSPAPDDRREARRRRRQLQQEGRRKNRRAAREG